MRTHLFRPITRQMACVILTATVSPAIAENDRSAVDSVDELTTDSQYIQYFKRLRFDQSATDTDLPAATVDDLVLDQPYSDFFRQLSIETLPSRGTSKNESLISPPGIETRGNETTKETANSPVNPPEPVDHTGLWTTLQQGFVLPELDSPLVSSYEDWFARHPSYITRVFSRGQIYLPYIVREIERRSMPMEVALLPVIESAFNPFAVSHAKAVGMWQFIAGTALDYLQFLEKDMHGNWFHAFAAYNGGEHRLHKEIKRNRRNGISTDFAKLRLHKETRHYVPRLIALRNVLRNPDRFGIELPTLENQKTFKSISLDYPIDLGIAAELAGLTLNEFRKLNPGYRRRTTGSTGGSRLLLPAVNAERLLSALATRSAKSLIAAAGYRVKSGDTLSQIARRNNLSIKAIRKANRLKGDFLKIGQVLTLPLASQKYAVLGQDGIGIYARASAANTPRDRITHRVRRGDTLTAIAKRYRVYVRQITGWNSMRETDVIHSGQQLVIFK